MPRRRPRSRPAGAAAEAPPAPARVAPLGRAGHRVSRVLITAVSSGVAALIVGVVVVLATRGSSSGCSADPDPNGWNGVGGGPLHRGSVAAAVHDPGPTWTPAWSFPGGAGGTPVVGPPSAANGTVYATADDGTLLALDGAKGTQLWSSAPASGEQGNAVVAPALDGCTAVVGTSFSDPKSGEPAGAVRAVDLTTHARLWGISAGDDVVSGPQLSRGIAFVGIGTRASGLNIDYAVDGFPVTDPGNPLRERFRAAVIGSPATDGRSLWAASLDEVAYAFAVDPGTRSLRQLWSFSTNGIITASPVVGDGIVYIASDDDSVYAIDQPTGKERWHATEEGALDATPVLNGSTLVVVTRDGKVHALDAGTGEQRWTVDIHDTVRVSGGGLAGAGQRVAVVGESGLLRLLDLGTGAERGRWQAAVGPHGAPAIAGGFLYLTVGDGHLDALPL